jgi:nicotinamidase-related amidase
MSHDKPEDTARIIFSSSFFTHEEGTAWVKRFPKHSAISFENPLTYAGYKEVPCSYLLCEDDLCIPADVQRAGIDMIERESGGRKVDVTSIKADHCPNWTAKQAVVDWIVDVAGKAVGTTQ